MSRRIVAVAVALLLAVLGTLAVLGYVRSADHRALAGQKAVEVYVAKGLVPGGTTLRSAIDGDLIQQETIAQTGVPANPLATVSPSTESLVAVSDIQPGELVLSDRFATTQASSSALTIPQGEMAVSISLADPARVAQFVTAGSEIAVFDTFNIRFDAGSSQVADLTNPTPAGDHIADDYGKTRATRLLLSRIKVLAVGATTTTSTGGTATSPSAQPSTSPGAQQTTLLTVAVTQVQAELLVQGIQTGTLYLGLLSDSSVVAPSAGVNDRNLFANR
jgi:pilus assembly protein CpaB